MVHGLGGLSIQREKVTVILAAVSRSPFCLKPVRCRRPTDLNKKSLIASDMVKKPCISAATPVLRLYIACFGFIDCAKETWEGRKRCRKQI